jgi:uncharacterized membrane protein YbhN (UPF0104 family)
VKRLFKPLLGVLLLIALFHSVGWSDVAASLLQTQVGWLGAALFFALLANLVCVLRWKFISDRLGLVAPYTRLGSLYFQGIFANSILPGGIVGGDVWRSMGLAQTACKTATPERQSLAAATVFLDRAAGFWGLAVLSLLALGALAVQWQSGRSPADTNMLSNATLFGAMGYAQTLAALLVLPWLAAGVGAPLISKFAAQTGRWQAKVEVMLQLARSTPLLLRTLPQTAVSQALGIAALACAFQAVGLDVPPLVITAVSCGIFLFGALPAAIGGFGARELGAVAFLAPLGFDEAAVIAGSILFGLTATIQGLAGLLAWLQTRTR